MQFATLSLGALMATVAVAAGSVLARGGCENPLLCCGELKTPLDSTVDPILKELGVDAAAIVGSVCLLGTTFAAFVDIPTLGSFSSSTSFCLGPYGLLLRHQSKALFRANICLMAIGEVYSNSCSTAPQCCSEAFLLVSLPGYILLSR